MDKEEQVFDCPHCGNKTVLEIQHTATTREELFDTDGKYFDVATAYYHLVLCKTCNNISLFAGYDIDESADALKDCTVLYPAEKDIPSNIPKAISQSYLEAKKVRKISHTAFLLLIRKALELMCNDKKAHGKNLKEKLKQLEVSGIIPETFSKMATVLRFLGNVSAHGKELVMGEKDTELIQDFFIALIEYVYVAPQKLATLEAKLKERKK